MRRASYKSKQLQIMKLSALSIACSVSFYSLWDLSTLLDSNIVMPSMLVTEITDKHSQWQELRKGEFVEPNLVVKLDQSIPTYHVAKHQEVVKTARGYVQQHAKPKTKRSTIDGLIEVQDSRGQSSRSALIGGHWVPEGGRNGGHQLLHLAPGVATIRSKGKRRKVETPDIAFSLVQSGDSGAKDE